MNRKWTTKLSLQIVPFLSYWLIKIWFSTIRVTEHDRTFRDQCREHERAIILTVWHNAIFYLFYHIRHSPGVALVSSSRDGEYIARVVRRFGFKTVRGSRNRRGVSALKNLIKAIRDGRNVGLVADGSQGPPLVVQPGSILLASKSGTPVLPVIWSVSSYWTINSWDRTILPKPFSRIEFVYGKPLYVDADIGSETLEEYRLELEERMLAIYKKAWAMQGKKAHISNR